MVYNFTKKELCIVKIWTSTCDEQNSEYLNIPESEQQSSCLFKNMCTVLN